MKKLIVKDNFIGAKKIKALNEYCKNIPHQYGHTSNCSKKDMSFYMANINPTLKNINYVCQKIVNLHGGDLAFFDTYINVQYAGMNGSFHKDEGHYTWVLMISPTLNKGSGCFITKKQSVDFVQDRLICLPAKTLHKGMAPKELAIPRITMAFKTEKVNEFYKRVYGK